MQKQVFSLLLFCFICFGAHTQNKLRAYLDTKQFYSPEIGHYNEVYIQVSGKSVSYIGKENGLIGQLSISIVVKDEEETVITDYYILESPFMADSIVEDFYDVRRYLLKPNSYNFSIKIKDINNNEESIESDSKLVIQDLSDTISLSGLEIIEYAYESNENNDFCKSGIHIIPRIINYYPEELNKIPYYLEVYNTNQSKDSIHYLKRSIIDLKDNKNLENYEIFSRLKSSPVIPIIKSVDISQLKSGNYLLKHTVIDRDENVLATNSYNFERSNELRPTFNEENAIIDPAFQASIHDDSVAYFLESLIPISKASEVKKIVLTIKSKNIEIQRKYIQSFWSKTAKNKPYDEWMKYKAQVLFVENIYANNFQEGFETDRGRVYLKYGAPTNIIIKETSPSEYPYEIWQYNKIEKYSNKRFVFYNPDLVNRAFRLLHSDMIGELKNPSWRQTLSKRNSNNGTIDNPNQYLQDHFGGNSNDLFRQYK